VALFAADQLLTPMSCHPLPTAAFRSGIYQSVRCVVN
jgi:hypothetical protein